MRKLATYRDSPEQDKEKIRNMKKKVFESDTYDIAMTKTDVKKRPGWNDDRLERYLGAPDFTTENSYRKNSITNWYMTKRVEKAEKYKTFQKEAQKSISQHAKRKEAGRKAAETKRAKTRQLVEDRLKEVILVQEVKGLKKRQLYNLAVDHYNDLHEWRAIERNNYNFEYATVQGSSEDFLERIAVNFLRHDGTTYDEELEAYFNQVGKHEAINAVRKHIYDLISCEYPYLSAECSRQMVDREVV